MAGEDVPPGGRGTPDMPSCARISNFWQDGHDNYGADRAQAREIERINPRASQMAANNRLFVARAGAWMAAGEPGPGGSPRPGIVQFADLGCGLPAASRTHEMIRSVRPDARVAYVDIDPEVVDHTDAMLEKEDGRSGLAVARADIRDPAATLTILEGLADPDGRRVIDLGQPAGLLLAMVLHYEPADRARETVAGYARLIAPGSCVAVSCMRIDDDGMWAQVAEIFTPFPVFNYTRAEFTALFGGLDLEPPGIAPAANLRPGWEQVPATPPGPAYVIAGIGRKP